MTLQASAGQYTHLDGPHGRIPVGSLKIGRIAADRAPYITNDVTHDPAISDAAWAVREGMVSFAGYPLIVSGEVVGVLGLFSRRALGEDSLDILASLADSLALGIRRLRVDAWLRQEGEIVDTLYRIGTVIAQEHQLASVAQTVVDAATQLTGAQFGTFFYNAFGDPAQQYTDWALSGAPREAFERFPMPRSTPVLAATFEGSDIVRSDDITADPRYGHNPPYYGMPAGHLPVRSYMAVPVMSRHGEVIGGLYFGHSKVGVFGERAQRVAMGIAGHGAIAIDSARLYEAEHLLGLRLQQALLPTGIPDIEGVELATRYVPASEHLEIGGDWYDVMDVPDGRLVVSVGDAMGHDLNAASVMSRIRNTIRAYAIEGHNPGACFARADLLLRHVDLLHMTTVLQASLDRATGRLEMARAGHMPALLLDADGRPRWLEEIPPGPPLGTGLQVAFETGAVQIGPGETLILLTDGLIERRDSPITEGMRLLADAATGGAGLDAEALCDHLLERMVTRGQVSD
ncbi:MAG: SpoIIE family protein phosphatase, partial [Acidimicrobiaceae bacterium]|nr:SpoIIE family protein phosphatase [Acidimicrobiaceae bacterium]